MIDRPPPSRWFLLLPLLAIAAWWPIEPYWQSDDFLALHYSQSLARTLHDFVGPQYGSTSVWFFYRPLITLSFWFDQCLGGTDPLVSHLSNVLAHGCSTLLAALLWRRFLPDSRACLAALLWAMLPSHIGSVAWAVGRVDSHTTVWCLLCLWLCVRHDERCRASRPSPVWPMLLAFAGALASKELAFVVPPLAALLVALRTPGPCRVRAKAAGRRTWPLFGLFVAYLGWRLWALGRLGGYEATQFEAPGMAMGLLHVVADLLVPLRWIGLEHLTGGGLPQGTWLWAAAMPIFVVAILLLRQPRWLAALGLFVVACVPMAGFLAAADNPLNLRYYYLPSIALTGLVAAQGRWLCACVALAWLWPLLAARSEQLQADRETAAMHRALQREVDEGVPGPLFVQGLPRTNRTHTSMQFHFGVDRLLQPPFGAEARTVLALRPITEAPDVYRLGDPNQPPQALPSGSTWWFADATALVRATVTAALPDLTVEGDQDGVVDLSSARLRQLLPRPGQPLTGPRELSIALQTRPGRPSLFRLTIFTATGYFCCAVPDHAAPTADHGTIDLLQFFGGDRALGVAEGESRVPPAQWAPDQYVMLGLEIPVAHDLDLDFPVLLEAGNVQNGGFVVSHRARRLLRFRFDRGYSAWMRWALTGK